MCKPCASSVRAKTFCRLPTEGFEKNLARIRLGDGGRIAEGCSRNVAGGSRHQSVLTRTSSASSAQMPAENVGQPASGFCVLKLF